MSVLLSLISAGALAGAPPPAATLSPEARKDVQCFVLYAVAVQQADEAKDDKVREAGTLGLMYFFGRLQAEAPGGDLVAAVRQEAQAIEAGETVKDVGAACDAEFQKRGAELMDLGKQLQQSAAPSPAA